MSVVTTTIRWDGVIPGWAANTLAAPGGLVVCPTKVGYILMTTDGAGLERKFDAKQRSRNKPGVVLCSSIEQLRELAELNDEILDFYQMHWDNDILLGCILPWREEALRLIPDTTAKTLAMDGRGTSCFVIKFGRPAEQLSEIM
jgi:tRNA A37 threonylcarbamoyladenosine synthetase subunit TsaC/SUA5/YrdC